MRLAKLYVRIEHYNDWSYYTRDFEGVRTSMRYYYPFNDRGYSFEVITVTGNRGGTVKSFIRRFRYLGNIVDVVSVGKINNRSYELVFLGDIKGMLKYVILEHGGIVISSYVDSGTKDFTAYFFTKDTNELETSLTELHNELSNHGKIITYKVSRFPKTMVFTSPIYSLTEIERKILQTAYHKGFFNYPRGINLDNLAKEFNISKATVNIHLRNALRKIISSYLGNNDYF
ncbi:helix-turn-helix domain-containing protein [Vulcanisaeta souniana]|uniref:HTH bat-type domain-containing protein n=2 Tax=Vulcanisaeta souniana JCM 11219 TaxID=1293586 RepID=A0ABM8BR89_9CREN|nr:helix-turn-helix domain-containing protein [Vulcanisaeta souniana]BDR93560.1 hypothetical protein Vsou_26530 [Vulcanisaeta souniana JCM 11219]